MANFEVFNFNGVDCYEHEGVAYLRLDAVARGLGFIDNKNGVEYIRWNRVEQYLLEMGFATSGERPQFIPENIFYRLAMKAKNEVAEKFQALVADEIIPSIRKTGTYRHDPFAQKRVEAALNESLSRRAEVILQCAKETNLSLWKELLIRNAAHVAIGQEVLPPPKSEKTYSAGEVGKLLGVSANLVGRIATKHGLKKDEYGVWCHDIARNGQKEVEVFRYNDNGVDAISNYINN